MARIFSFGFQEMAWFKHVMGKFFNDKKFKVDKLDYISQCLLLEFIDLTRFILVFLAETESFKKESKAIWSIIRRINEIKNEIN